MINFFHNKKYGFSLAEALAAMMIISMALLAFSPVISKRKTKSGIASGYWECYLTSNGKHRTRSQNYIANGLTDTDDKCVFRPQANAKEYYVTVVGGGGGGASGKGTTPDAVSFGEPVRYTIETADTYKVAMVGGGGGGSAYLHSRYTPIGGSAGMPYYGTHYLTPGIYTLAAGYGGAAGGALGDDTGCEKQNPSTNDWMDVCNGADGLTSYLYGSSGNVIASARGGYGGVGNASRPASLNDQERIWTRRAEGTRGGQIQWTTDNFPFESFYATLGILSGGGSASSAFNFAFGTGGDGVYSSVGTPGNDGIVVLSSGKFYSGGGGKVGSVTSATLKNLTEDVPVIVGKGGTGSQLEDTPGNPGENSSFGYFLISKGGNGGEVKALSSMNSNNTLNGEDGEKSPFDPATYGAGGKGGFGKAARMYTSYTPGTSNNWGKGEDGKSGFVRVEWN